MKSFPLSGIQASFWIASKMLADSPAYNIASCVKLEGALDKDRLRDAWRQVFESAQIFKTCFGEVNGQPLARVDEDAVYPWQELDCPEREVFKTLAHLCYDPFDLGAAPLVRVALVRVQDDCHYLFIAQHHLITDLDSKEKLGVLISDVYNRKQTEFPTSPYSSFVETETDFLDGAGAQKHFKYWQDKMDAFPGVLDLPCEKPARTFFKGKGDSVAWRLPAPIYEMLTKKMASDSKQPFLWLLTAYILFLARISGQRNLAVGVPLTNRRFDGASSVLGPFVNVLPVCVAIDENDTFEALYTAVRKEMLLNHRYQEIPFFKIAGFSKSKREPHRPNIIQAGFTSEPLLQLDLNNLKCTAVAIKKYGAQLDLFFTYWPTATGFDGYWEYNSDRFSRDLIDVWQDGYNTLVKETLAQPEKHADSFRILNPASEKRIHTSWNATTTTYQAESNLARQLQKGFAKHRNEVALIHEERPISYGEMASIVTCMSRVLYRTYGQRKHIALFMDRSPELVYAIHAVIQSGNVYVPIGVDWPRERIRMVLDDVQPVLIISDEEKTGLLPQVDMPVATTGQLLRQGRGDGQSGDPAISIEPGDSAYIIYTSGSTGMPKGAELPHAGVLNRILWMQDEYKLSPKDRVLQKTPYTFDVSVWEFIWPFFAGAALVIAKPEGHKDPRYLRTLIDQTGVTVLHFVPSMLSVFLKTPGVEILSSIRDVICSGEALSKKQEKEFFNAFKTARLHNLYGPTEASVDVTSWQCRRDTGQTEQTVPIGKPIANTQTYIVDKAFNLCPPYVTGELLLGGVQLAKGYWNRKQLTAEKFIPNPFGTGKVYRTGDLARYRLDGTIEYLGRTDFQVKIRGLRVELGEIEHALLQHEAIQQCVVTLWERRPGDSALVAYLVARPPHDDLQRDLKVYLQKHLPAYMMPSCHVFLDRLPINPNGKLDRKALPVPTPNDTRRREQKLPESDLIKAIRRCWQSVLANADFGVEDNFFDVGGDSLSLIKLGQKLEREFETEIEVLDLFRYPSINEMVRLVNREAKATDTAHRERAQTQRNRLRALAARRRG